MKQFIVLLKAVPAEIRNLIAIFASLSIIILILAIIATVLKTTGSKIGGDPIDSLSIISFYIMSLAFGTVAWVILDHEINKVIKNAFKTVEQVFENFCFPE